MYNIYIVSWFYEEKKLFMMKKKKDERKKNTFILLRLAQCPVIDFIPNELKKKTDFAKR